MGTGYLRIQVTTGGDALPVAGADVTIKQRGSAKLYRTRTGADGKTEDFPFSAPPMSYTLNPSTASCAYSLCDVDIKKEGFITKHIRGVEIVDTQTSILPVSMEPLAGGNGAQADSVFKIPLPGPAVTYDYRKFNTIPLTLFQLNTDNTGNTNNSAFNAFNPSPRAQTEVVIPDYITVHLGRPENTSARNIRVRFPEYVKNVASSEIYSTWPEQSLLANIYAIISFALNRVYTEWYPSKGYNFDITNSTSFDQYFREGGPIFENISSIVDEVFNTYAHRFGFRNPFFTQFCNGTTVTCPGLSQWGTVTLANQGMEALEILRYYYPRDLQLTVTDNIAGISLSYPGEPLTLGSEGEDVRRIQNDLNRIRVNYPLIPIIPNPNGNFTPETQNAVMTFQKIFNLPANGVVNQATWNKISSIFNAVSRLGELDSEGIRYTIGMNPPDVVLSQGSRGGDVLELQHILNMVSVFYASVPPVIMDSVFGEQDKNAVIEFQKTFNLPQTGIVNAGTWNMLYTVYRGIRENVPIPAYEPPVQMI
ncbi:MAG: peptidoglycan-binding protein [Oscillospiraceae bacterium]|nr:peptidoglycan-binding protein [Oscillospiraceae bacterium]